LLALDFPKKLMRLNEIWDGRPLASKLNHAAGATGVIVTALIIVDFDGTVVRQDATDLILERFALPEWRAVEQEWVAGRIGSRECLARQVDLIRATDQDLDDVIAELEIDPAFFGFVTLCQVRGFDVVIGSDGLDRIIAPVLKRCGLALPFVSNRLTSTGGGRWRVDFPHFDPACEVSSGTCKCAISGRAAVPTLLVGDGRSDFCVAARAKWVLAKGQLAHHCRQSKIPHVPIDGFADAIAALPTLFPPLVMSRMSAHSPHDILAGADHA
jgi:2-hydroxy-3-keto-5-methylthiopentenyl-1-phosphate phosphatase